MDIANIDVDHVEPTGAKRSQATARAIQDAALALFRQVGYHGTTVRAIARLAGVNVAALYHHFESKQGLLVHIMYTSMEENVRAIGRAVEAAGDPVSELVGAVQTIVDYHVAHPAHAFVGTSELRSLETDGRRAIVALRDEEEALLAGVVRRGTDQGVFGATDPKLATRAIIAMCSAVATWYRDDGPLSRTDVRDQYVGLSLSLLRCVRE